MSDVFVIIDQEALKGLAHPCLDLLTGQIIELDLRHQVVPPTTQMELFDADDTAARAAEPR
ncbi:MULTISPECIES: hypothetical protein [Pseudomonas]|uniref:Uncharacterized protein n=1 Tax=Pseudomonas fluorescens TaxID=294 RepID=A0A166MTL4_PSEFL|nr:MULTISPECIES: hypothetical protein [Pseudomonas]KZN16198.1 hypothetical protein A1D17_08525 [Pseudomonas fluorescens]